MELRLNEVLIFLSTTDFLLNTDSDPVAAATWTPYCAAGGEQVSETHGALSCIAYRTGMESPPSSQVWQLMCKFCVCVYVFVCVCVLLCSILCQYWLATDNPDLLRTILLRMRHWESFQADKRWFPDVICCDAVPGGGGRVRQKQTESLHTGPVYIIRCSSSEYKAKVNHVRPLERITLLAWIVL